MARFAVNQGLTSTGSATAAVPGLVAEQIANLGGIPTPNTVVNSISGVGNLSGAYTLDLSGGQITIAGTGTLTGDTTITVTGFSAGSFGMLTLVQDATGSHAVSVVANGVTITPTVPTSGAFVMKFTSTDGNLFVEVTAVTLMVGAILPLWTGTIATLVNGQLDTTVWPYQAVTPGHLTVLTDPLGTQGTVLEYAITETG